MRTATVEELHDQQAEVLNWVQAGEEVAISHKGIVIARLVPEKIACSVAVTMSAKGVTPTYLRERGAERVLSTGEVTALLDENKGSW